jgi:hypothetical protein
LPPAPETVIPVIMPLGVTWKLVLFIEAGHDQIVTTKVNQLLFLSIIMVTIDRHLVVVYHVTKLYG